MFAACAFGAWLWRMLRQVSGSLMIPVLAHIAADISIVTAVYLRLFTR